ncbi:MAG: hypothetical protein V1495_08120 [Pseudomonadota bacterium]
MRKGIAIVVLLLGLGTARAEALLYQDHDRTGSLAGNGAIGFTLGPDTFLVASGVDYYFTRHFTLGPLLQMGVSDDVFLVSPTVEAKGVFDLPVNGFGRRVKPFVQGGAGFTYANVDRAGKSDNAIDFMFNLGFGVDIYLTTRFAMGNNMLFNVTPTRVFRDRLIFAWQFVSLKYHF